MKKVLVLLIGEVLEDPRVYRTCMSLSESGADVTVACTNPSQRAERETYKKLSIIRFPHRTEFILKKLYGWLRGKLHPDMGRILGRGHEEVPSSSLIQTVRNAALRLNYRHYMRCNRNINRMMVKALAGGAFDLVHSNDVDTLFAGAELKRMGSAKALLYDAHEYWTGIGVHGSKPNEDLGAIEVSGIAEADFVVTVNQMIAEKLKDQYRLSVMPSVVMNCPYRYHGDLHIDRVHSPVRVIYQGKLQAFRGLEELVLAFVYIPDAVLTMAGYGPLEESLKHLAVTRGLTDRVIFTGRYDPDDTLTLLADQDIGVMPFRDVTLNIVYTSPNKFFDYSMAGLAVAASDLPFLSSTIGTYGMGRLFERIEPENIAVTLNSMISDTELLVTYKKNARKAALKTFYWEEQFYDNYPWKP